MQTSIFYKTTAVGLLFALLSACSITPNEQRLDHTVSYDCQFDINTYLGKAHGQSDMHLGQALTWLVNHAHGGFIMKDADKMKRTMERISQQPLPNKIYFFKLPLKRSKWDAAYLMTFKSKSFNVWEIPTEHAERFDLTGNKISQTSLFCSI